MSQESNRILDVKITDVLSMLENGKTRQEIAAHYGLTLAEAKKWIFSHEKLKHKKTHKAPTVNLVDDTVDAVIVTDDTAADAVHETWDAPAPTNEVWGEVPQTDVPAEAEMQSETVTEEATSQADTPVAEVQADENLTEAPATNSSEATW